MRIVDCILEVISVLGRLIFDCRIKTEADSFACVVSALHVRVPAVNTIMTPLFRGRAIEFLLVIETEEVHKSQTKTKLEISEN